MSAMSHPQERREVFLDARGNGRALRLSWHHDADVVVLSLWRDGVCAGTFRLPRPQVGDFVDALVEGLRDDDGAVLSTSYQGVQPDFMNWAFDETPDQRASAG